MSVIVEKVVAQVKKLKAKWDPEAAKDLEAYHYVPKKIIVDPPSADGKSFSIDEIFKEGAVKDLKPFEYKIAKEKAPLFKIMNPEYGLSVDDIVKAQPMVQPHSILFYESSYIHSPADKLHNILSPRQLKMLAYPPDTQLELFEEKYPWQ